MKHIDLKVITGEPDEQTKQLQEVYGVLFHHVGRIIRYARKEKNIC